MFTKFTQRTLLLALTTGLVHTAQAAEYTNIDQANSQITFSYSQMSVNMEGKIPNINVPTFRFDPQAPENAELSIEIPVNNIDAGNPEANKELQKADWLKADSFPLASFNAQSIKALGDQQFELQGQLVIKGKTQNIRIPVTFTEQGDSAQITGQLIIKRSDFAIGEGSWSDTSIVADEIQVKFDIQAKP